MRGSRRSGGSARTNMAKRPQIKNCPVCGRPYVEMGRKMCRECYEKEEKMELEVIHYVRDHPKATGEEVMEATGVPASVIRRMIREGRFVDENFKIDYPCARCGRSIITGKLCQDCLAKLHNRIQKATKELQIKQAKEETRIKGMFTASEDGETHVKKGKKTGQK